MLSNAKSVIIKKKESEEIRVYATTVRGVWGHVHAKKFLKLDVLRTLLRHFRVKNCHYKIILLVVLQNLEERDCKLALYGENEAHTPNPHTLT